MVELKGWRGMWWEGFMELASQRSLYVALDILVMHLGGNDLALRSGKFLILQVITDLRAFMALSCNAHCLVSHNTTLGLVCWL